MVALQASDHEKNLTEVRRGLDQTRQELAEVTRRENALVRQQTTMSVEMVAEGKARKAAEEEVCMHVILSLHLCSMTSLHNHCYCVCKHF